MFFIISSVGDNAFYQLQKITSFGPRTPGTRAHKKCRNYIKNVLKNKGFNVEIQRFKKDNAEFFNIIGTYGKGKKLLIGTHYDTYPGIPGANDSGSGTAVLLALLDSLKAFDFAIQVVFFDGEDFGNAPLYGSKYFSDHINPIEYYSGIIVDMIGDKHLGVYQEINSLKYAPHITRKVFEIAYINNLKSFFPFPKYEIIDDHIPLNRKGVRTILLIDFDYPFWHTPQDDIDKCSKESLEEVGRLILLFLRWFENER